MPEPQPIPEATVALAAAALQGILANPELSHGTLVMEAIAEDAARLAALTLEELAKQVKR